MPGARLADNVCWPPRIAARRSLDGPLEYWERTPRSVLLLGRAQPVRKIDFGSNWKTVVIPQLRDRCRK